MAFGLRWVRRVVLIAALFAVAAVALWEFLPQRLLPPKEVGTILNRATSGQFITFNEGGPGRRTLVLSTGTNLWEIPSGKQLEPGTNVGYILSPDGGTFLANNRLSLFDWRSRKGVALANPAPQWVPFTTGGGTANRFIGPARFSDDGNLLAASRRNGSLYLLSAKSGKVIHTLRDGSNQITPYNGGRGTCTVSSLAFSRDGKVLASGELNGDITLWNTSTGDEVKTLKGGPGEPCQGTTAQQFDAGSQILALGFSPDGRLLASEDHYGVIRLWEVRSGKLRYVLPCHFERPFEKVEFSPDGRFLVTASENLYTKGELYLVWDAVRVRLLRALTFTGYGTFDFAPDGNLIIAQLESGRVKVQEWALRSQFRLPLSSSAPASIAQSEKGITNEYEESAIQELNHLEGSLGEYMGGKGNGSFPAKFIDLGNATPALKGMYLVFLNGRPQGELSGYRFQYIAGKADPQGRITSFVLSARPLLYRQTGTRSFRVDQAGHAYATVEGREAKTTDQSVSGVRSAVQVADALQNVAREQAAVHLARAQTLFQQRQFQAAIAECNVVLEADPSNQRAARLKSRIQQTMSILGVR